MTEQEALESFSRGEMTALDLRRRLDGATYGEILQRIADAHLPLPRAPTVGREEQIAQAHAWMFPEHVQRP